MSTQPVDLLARNAEQLPTNTFYTPILRDSSWVETENRWMVLLELVSYGDYRRLAYYYRLKRWLDVIVTSVLLVLLSLPLLVIACLIYCTMGGPVIFRQVRVGRNGQPFVMYKFRSMMPDRRINAEAFTGAERRVRHKTARDPRITPFGRFLRQTSIDELPQLINVLRGDMSLIGPRPELPHIVRGYAAHQHRRHLVRPGITGWWQVQGRSELPMHEHTELDIYYVEHVSFAFDMQILVRTVRVVFSRKGAY